MKRPKSKFSSKLPKYQDGSLLPDFGTASPLDKAKGVGAALDVVTSLVPTKTFKGVSGIGDISATAADKYNKHPRVFHWHVDLAQPCNCKLVEYSDAFAANVHSLCLFRK